MLQHYIRTSNKRKTGMLVIIFSLLVCISSITAYNDRRPPLRSNRQSLRSGSIVHKSSCLFCSLQNKRYKHKILYEDDMVFVINDKTPRAPTHLLIIPKKHIVNIKTLRRSDRYDQKLLSHMGFVAQRISQRLSGTKDFTVLINNGASSHQTIFHLHMHFLSPEKLRFRQGKL